MDAPIIQEFEIRGLFGYKNVQIKFRNNVLILIGENGYGKTTILNAINYTLQGRYKELLAIKFDSIRIKIAGDEFGFEHSQLKDYFESLMHDDNKPDLVDYLKRNLAPTEFETILKLVGQNKKITRQELNNPAIRHFPISMVMEDVNKYLLQERKFGVFPSLKKKIASLQCKFMYEPTYRRVEVNLNEKMLREDFERRFPVHLSSYEEELNQSYASKIIKFGMNDVDAMIKGVTEMIKSSSLNGFAKVSGDMIRQLINFRTTTDVQQVKLDKNRLKIILGRTGDNLTQEEKNRFIEEIEKEGNTNNTYLNYFLEQLYKVYDSLKQYDTAIKQFIDVCNGYFTDKKFVYDEGRVELKIYRCEDGIPIINNQNEVILAQLSSGEKQIVSLFAQIYLDFNQNFAMLLDEPELSLSIFWQERLLKDIVDSGKCVFLMVVTHSPFIFRKYMSEYVVGMQEFIEHRV